MVENVIDPLELEYRMYCFVLYNLSPIQQGIQSAHAIVEYANAFMGTPQYQKWAGKDKTIIILNGKGSEALNDSFKYVVDNELADAVGFFKEPDLYNQMTAFCFLVDERVWNTEKYPDEASVMYDRLNKNKKKRTLGSVNIVPAVHYEFNEEAYIKSIGGENQYKLKEFLSYFRLA